MSSIKLYETEQLVYVENRLLGRCEYWVLRHGGINPLYSLHKVRRRHIAQAVALFKDHPSDITKVKNKDLRYFEGEKWTPETALYNKLESVDLAVENLLDATD